MLLAFQQQLKQYFPTQSDFMLGLSGGVDSVVLLQLLAQSRRSLKLNVRAIHIHHGLSPNADAWASVCQNLCQTLEIPLLIKKVKVEGKQGIEAQARHARYQAIGQTIRPNEVLVTAHHLDDQVETFFLALKRGSGVKGLGAMQAVSFLQNFAIFRPLLTISKQEILDYAKQHRLVWVEDESNQNTDYERNFLRQEILPPLNQRWQQFSHMVARTAQHCREQQKLIEELLEHELTVRMDEARKRLDIRGFELFSAPKQQALVRLWLEKCKLPMPSMVQLEQIIHRLILAKPDKTPQIQLGKQMIRRYQQHIFVTPPDLPKLLFSTNLTPCAEVTLPDELGVIKRNDRHITYTRFTKTAHFSLPENLAHQPLELKFQSPIRVKLLNRTQHEEMKKIWQQQQVPVWERGRVPLLFCDEILLFVLKMDD